MTVQQPPRPSPVPDALSRPFFEGLQRHELLLMYNPETRTYALPYSEHAGGSPGKVEWVRASGRGRVFSFGIMHRVYHPAFAEEVPYNVAVVELEEGPRIPANLVDVANTDISVGMAVEVVFAPIGGGLTVPKFRPARQGPMGEEPRGQTR